MDECCGWSYLVGVGVLAGAEGLNNSLDRQSADNI
jgi:hypothetical protein